jgi:hypothetical protein
MDKHCFQAGQRLYLAAHTSRQGTEVGRLQAGRMMRQSGYIGRLAISTAGYRSISRLQVGRTQVGRLKIGWIQR